MASPAAVLEILVTANSAHATTALARTDAQLKSTAATAQTTTSRMGQRFSALASVAKTALIGGVAYGLYSGAKAGIEFEKQMDAVGAVADASAKQMRKLEQQALRLGQKTAYSASEAAQAQEELAKGGLKASEILGGALKSSLSLAAAGQLDLGEAAMTTVNAMKLFGMRAKDAGRIADMFATAANKTTADVEDFAAALKQGGSAAKTAGYDLNETMTVLEALAEAGIKNSDAGTSMKTAFLQLLAPTEKQKQLAEQLNIQWTDQRGNLKSAAGLSKELQQALGGMTNAQQAANLKILAGTDGFRTLSALYDAGPAKLRELARANAEQGTAQEIAKKKMDNTAGSIEQLKGAWETLSISLFKKAESPFRSIIDGMTDAVQDLTDVVTDKKLTTDEKISKLADMVSHALAGAIPKVAKIAAKIGTTLVKGIATAFWEGDLLTRLFIGAAALRIFGGAGVFRSLGGKAGAVLGKAMGRRIPMGLAAGVVLATALLAPDVYKLGVKLGKQLKKPFRDFFKWVVDTFGGVADKVMGVFSGLIGGIADIYDKLAGIPVIGEAFKPIADGLHDVEDSINGVRDAMRDIREFRKNPLGFTREALRQNAGDVGAVVDKLVAMGISYKRAIRLATKAGDEVGPSLRRNQQALDLLGSRLGTTGDKWDGYGHDLGRSLDRGNKDTDKHRDKVKAGMDRIRDQLGQSAGKAGDYEHDLSKSFGKTTGSSARMAKGVGRNVSSLANGVATGLETIKDNLNKSLAAFSVKKVSYSIKKAGNAVGNVVGGFQHGGPVKSALVPGTGSGDKVPLHIGGQLAAMVEPNELVSVTNRTATAALMAHNRRVPRRRGGGVVPHLAKGGTVGGATGGLHPAILQLVSSLYQRFGGSISSGLRTGTGSLHATGQAADYVPGNWAGAASAVNRVGSSLLEGIYNPQVHGGPAVSWDSGSNVPTSFWGGDTWADHMDHIHLAIADGTKAVIGATVDRIKRVMLKGPDGPLKDMGQSALDKVRDAANRYLASKMPPIGAGKFHGPIKGLPEALQKYNRTYAEHNSAEGDWGGYRMPFNAVAALAEWAGAPGVSMARTAIGESNLRPGATGVDRGGTKGYGLWMITTSFNDDLVKPYGGYGQMLNPVLNAQVMNKILDRQGYGAWYSDTLDTSGTHYNGPLLRKYGGLVPHLAKGGKAGDKPLHGTATPGPVTNAFKRFRKARRIAKQLKDLLGERGRVARVDERIANAEALAGLASSEAGSEMSPKELARQIRLNELLLANLVKARKLARSGLGLTRWPKGMSVDKRTEGLMKGLAGGFRSNLVDLTGLTGAGGRIFETKNIIDELKHTTGAGPAALDISGLRSVIEAARYGVFDGYFARGGNLKPGRWGIAGERGPEVVHGPSTVLSPRATQDVLAPKVEVHNEFDFDGLDLYVTTKVNGEIAKRERVNHRRGRQAVR